MQKTSLSYPKLKSLLEKNKYQITNVYSEEGSAKFLEVKSPHYHKTFYVNISSRYRLEEIVDISIIDISLTDVNENQQRYIEMFPDIGSVILISDTLCFYNSKFTFYKFGKMDVVFDNDPKEAFISELEKRFKDIKDVVKSVDTYTFEKHSVPDDNITEIIFEDETGMVIEKGSNIEKLIISAETPKKVHIDSNTVVDFVSEAESVVSSTHSLADSDVEEDMYSSNQKPENLKNVNVGMLYVCININDFMKTMKDYEQPLMDEYSMMTIKERELRDEKMRVISETLEKLKISSFEKLKEIDEEEKKINEQIVRLSAVLVQCEKLEKYGKQVEDIVIIMKNTHDALDELHLRLLNLKDKSFDILNRYISIEKLL